MASDLPTVKPPRIETVHCNDCGRKTRHTVLEERIQSGSEPIDDEYSISWQTTWTMLECCGCEAVCLRRSHWFSEWDPSGGEQVTFFPPPISRRAPQWLDELPDEEGELLKEVYAALNAGSVRLVTMGTRALIDMVMDRHVKGVSGFGARLNALETKGLIGSREREVLEAALDAGHAATHRGHAPSPRDVEILIDVVENALQAELLVAAARRLRKHTPRRRRQRARADSPVTSKRPK